MLDGMTTEGRFAGWLSCPDCERDLDPVTSDQLVCSSGHRFETNRRGYVGLVPAGRRVPGVPPAAADPLWDVSTSSMALTAMLPRRGRILELSPRSTTLLAAIGSGAGQVTAAALSASPRDLERVVSATGAAAVLADPARRWPLRDGAVAALVAIDVPLVPLEFHRVLAAGGTLIVAPTETDAGAVIDDLSPWFEHDQSRPVPAVPRTALRLRRRRRMLTW
jgi:23S rRNA (guanine745-N1)-methyltransferase